MEEPKKSWVKQSVFSKIFWGGPGPNDKGLSRKHILEGTIRFLLRDWIWTMLMSSIVIAHSY
ncbi:hypothetical protein NC653_018052 [Populus alba x Populus x berolinensis]|uniref:Uncharacterized protein n=1 Tax=Populus alba x Populus x berolinensis TaxID=444605 RepID=A0AAD6W205_9ROSI|nr:hypothetical protein NC653_018052 [Populus alba x Populus x berolinensis]